MIGIVRLVIGILLVSFLAGPAGADIWVWRDTSGVSHYTNELARIPDEHREHAHRVAKAWERPPLPKEEPEPEPSRLEAEETEKQESVRVVVDVSDKIDSAYRTGFEAGRRTGQERRASPAPAPVVSQTQSQSVQITTPPEPRRDRLFPFVGTAHGLAPGAPPPHGSRFERDENAPFANTAAGPPPVGAAGR